MSSPSVVTENLDCLGICVLNWNAGDCVSACVRSLEAARESLGFHLVVVDNDSSDDSIRNLLEEFPHVAVIRSRSNVGYSAGNNIGAHHLEALGCEYLLFVNPDVLVPAESLVHFVSTLAGDPDAGCAGGVPLDRCGRIGPVGRRRPTVLQKIAAYGPLKRAPFLARICRDHWVFPQEVRNGGRVYAAIGACLGFRAEAFREIGRFDENTFLYEEEFIIAERMSKKGWKVVVSTEAFYSHWGAASTQNAPNRSQLHFCDSEHYLLREYYGWPTLACSALHSYRMLEWCVYWAWWRTLRCFPSLEMRWKGGPPVA